METALLSDTMTEVLIPVAALIGIAFSLLQLMLVARVQVAAEKQSTENGGRDGYRDSLIEEEGINDLSVVVKCAKIQNAISEGERFLLL
ncbi:Pyrophosphate-energized vacuolar membrane proton pump [Apostasia shenzhenica]|uniref:Pyrophosphate-energized vacuolar membrane proton pump n=1 Tax=Apostasia shenzhenica TaxID=1088818 RepID=A0A2I0AM00_9ASPA|nr:Pyrophosphate-energized vacuolar membrane proton pump [Apostasia shenzhenica]